MPFHLDNRFWILDFGKKSEIYNLKSKISKVKRGFTLIELLVVISIIGILASFVIASFNSAQQKGRDSKRKSDLDAIQKALELTKGDSTGGAYYPGCSGTSPCYVPTSSLVPALASSYIRAVPSDPSYGSTGSSVYQYYPIPTAVASGTATGYALSACLENNNEAVAGFVTSSANWSTRTCPGTKIYVLNNP